MTAPRRRGVFAIVVALVTLPALVVVAEAASYYSRFGHNGAIVSSGVVRVYRLYVPPSYDATRRTPLVITLHGASLSGPTQMDISGWNRIADREGFIAVYPSGGTGGGPRHWDFGDGPRSSDIRFIDDLIDTLRGAYNIDTTRIYANGLSNGGGMSFALSCTMPKRIAAVGLVGAAMTSPFDWCPDRTPVPVIVFHGTADNAAGYDGGKSWVGPVFPPVRQWVQQWAQRNGCASAPTDDTIRSDVIRRSYHGCRPGADVVLYSIIGAGHTWPGGPPIPEWAFGRTATSIDASDEMWAFFEEHPHR